MVTLTATVRNEYGIHCRPSLLIAQEAKDYPGSITVRDGSNVANAKSVLELMSLAICCDHHLSISVEGPDEDAIAHRFAALFEKRFDFPR